MSLIAEPRATRPSCRPALATGGLALLCTTLPLFAQTRVDLRANQTPFKNQGGRTTCIVFGSVAALEAAYKRANYGDIDLSEEFCNYLGKMNWLHPNWDTPSGPSPQLKNLGAGYTENQVAAFGGGNGRAYIVNFKNWLRVPRETYMPYKTAGYNLGAYSDWQHIYWKTQTNANKQNLDPANLPRRALTAPEYFSVRSFTTIGKPNDPNAIEAALRLGREVVWDFHVRGTSPNLGVWQYQNVTSRGGHSMLIVGYDRTSSNPANHYFICKNSWGSTGAMGDGFTYISYNYLRQNGYSSAYIDSVETPAAWPELAFIGRRNLAFDGHRGTLDIYHIPGASQAEFDSRQLGIKDYRIGTFEDGNGKMHRVNGIMDGKKLIFWFRGSQPNMGWGDLRETPILARRFMYFMVDPLEGEIAGWHHDNAGTTPSPAYGGYARVPSTVTAKDGYLQPDFNASQAWAPENYLGAWTTAFDSTVGTLSFQERNDYLISTSLRTTYAALGGEFIEYTGARRPFVATVLKSRPAEISITFTHTTRGSVRLRGYMLSWQRGVFAGDAYSRSSYSNGFYAWRTGVADIPGYLSHFGSGCAGSNGRLTQTVSGVPFLGKTSVFSVTWGPTNGAGVWAIGVRTTSFQMPGTSCLLRIDPLLSVPIRYSALGTMQTKVAMPNNRSLIGSGFYSQFAAFDKQANKGGLTTSNGAYLRVGGWK